MSNQNLLQFVWHYFASHDDDMIVIRKSMIDICDGDFSAAMMISQVLYWHNKYKDMNRWIKITNKEWHDQCRLTEWKIRSANKTLKALGFVEIEVKKFNKIPSLHYKINFEALSKALNLYIENEFRIRGNLRNHESDETSEPHSDETSELLTEHTKQSIQQRGTAKTKKTESANAAPPQLTKLFQTRNIKLPKNFTPHALKHAERAIKILDERGHTLEEYLNYLQENCANWLYEPYELNDRQRINDFYIILKPSILIKALDGEYEDKKNVT